MTVEVVEGGGGILASDLTEDGFTARMGVEEVGEIVYGRVDDAPGRVVGGVTANLVAGVGLGGRWHGSTRSIVFLCAVDDLHAVRMDWGHKVEQR